MPRIQWAAAQSASTEPQLRYRLMADITMTSTTMYLCNGTTPIPFNSTTYTPVGGLGGIEQVEEAADMYPRAVRMWLRAVGSADLYEPLTENLFGKKVIIRRAFLKPDNTLVSTPEQRFSGYINKCEIHLADGQKGNYCEIEVESRLRREPRSSRYTKEYLWNASVTSSNGVTTAGVFSGDTFLNYVELIPGFQVKWGTASTFWNQGLGKFSPWINNPGWWFGGTHG